MVLFTTWVAFLMGAIGDSGVESNATVSLPDADPSNAMFLKNYEECRQWNAEMDYAITLKVKALEMEVQEMKRLLRDFTQIEFTKARDYIDTLNLHRKSIESVQAGLAERIQKEGLPFVLEQKLEELTSRDVCSKGSYFMQTERFHYCTSAAWGEDVLLKLYGSDRLDCGHVNRLSTKMSTTPSIVSIRTSGFYAYPQCVLSALSKGHAVTAIIPSVTDTGKGGDAGKSGNEVKDGDVSKDPGKYHISTLALKDRLGQQVALNMHWISKGAGMVAIQQQVPDPTQIQKTTNMHRQSCIRVNPNTAHALPISADPSKSIVRMRADQDEATAKMNIASDKASFVTRSSTTGMVRKASGDPLYSGGADGSSNGMPGDPTSNADVGADQSNLVKPDEASASQRQLAEQLLFEGRHEDALSVFTWEGSTFIRPSEFSALNYEDSTTPYWNHISLSPRVIYLQMLGEKLEHRLLPANCAEVFIDNCSSDEAWNKVDFGKLSPEKPALAYARPLQLNDNVLRMWRQKSDNPSLTSESPGRQGSIGESLHLFGVTNKTVEWIFEDDGSLQFPAIEKTGGNVQTDAILYGLHGVGWTLFKDYDEFARLVLGPWAGRDFVAWCHI